MSGSSVSLSSSLFSFSLLVLSGSEVDLGS